MTDFISGFGVVELAILIIIGFIALAVSAAILVRMRTMIRNSGGQTTVATYVKGVICAVILMLMTIICLVPPLMLCMG
jgi:hypothetical protein